MYICICKGVTDKAIRQAVLQGAERMRDLRDSLGVTEQCGICACHAKMVLEQTLMEEAANRVLQSEPTACCASAI